MLGGYNNPNQQYQRGAVKNLVQKALLTAQTNVGEGLIPQHLEKLITNTIVRLAPEIAVISPQYDAQKYHEFNRLTALPAGGGMIGESGTTPTLRSTYQRTGRILKVLRRKGAVTNFLQDASKNYVDAASVEMENHVQAHVYDMVTEIMYGNDNADALMWPGLDTFIATNRQNEVRGGVVPGDLSFLDNMIDANIQRQGASHRRVFIMSPQMLSKVSRLLTNVRLNQGLSSGGMSEIDIPGGWRLQAYRDIPIIQSTQCRPVGSMGTLTTSFTANAGTVPAKYYAFQVSYVDWNGESLASAESVIQATDGTHCVKVAFTAIAGAFLYKVYCSNSASSGAQNAEKLTCIIPAQLYDSNGTPQDKVIAVEFSTDPSVANPTILQINSTAVGSAATLGGIVPTITTSVSTAQANDLPLVGSLTAPPEVVFFWDLDEIQGLGKFAYTNAAGSRFNGLVTLEPLAKTDDNLPFMVKTYGTMIDSWEATSFMDRGLRVA
jgi:hypothetical protein